jgi:hypothetical protein
MDIKYGAASGPPEERASLEYSALRVQQLEAVLACPLREQPAAPGRREKHERDPEWNQEDEEQMVSCAFQIHVFALTTTRATIITTAAIPVQLGTNSKDQVRSPWVWTFVFI